MTVTIGDVHRIHAEHVARGTLTPAECVQGTRTVVHGLLQAESPLPCTDLTPDMIIARERRTPLTLAEKLEQEDHQRAQVTPEQQAAYRAARAAGDRNAAHCPDAHKWVQMKHQTALWERTDRLVAEAGVK